MTEKEVHDIFIAELGNSEFTHIAIMNTYYKILLKTLRKRLDEDNKSAGLRSMLDDTAYAKSRLRLLTTLTVDQPPLYDLSGDVLFVHKQWLAILNYFCDNYDHPNLERIRKRWPIEELKKAKERLEKFSLELEKEIKSDGSVSVPLDHFPMIEELIDFFHQTLIGKNRISEFLNEFNQAVTILALYQENLNMPVPDKVS